MSKFQVAFGDILSLDQGVIIHGCNAYGVMGSGLAASIKNQYPKVYQSYLEFVKSYEDKFDLLGNIDIVEIHPNLFICNAITQLNFGTDRRYVNYKALKECFSKLKSFVADMNSLRVSQIPRVPHLSINYPMIGSGLAGGDWSIISDIIDAEFSDSTVARTLWLNRQ